MYKVLFELVEPKLPTLTIHVAISATFAAHIKSKNKTTQMLPCSCIKQYRKALFGIFIET